MNYLGTLYFYDFFSKADKMKTKYECRQLIPYTLAMLAGLLWLLSGCTSGQQGTQSDEWKTYRDLKAALAQKKDTIDYDTLMEIHRTIRQAKEPIPHLNAIISSLITKRNPDPRVDNIILIVAAVSIGDSPYPIENAGRLFETILDQDHRLNSWVLAYVGDAIGKYPVDLPQGDHIADVLEQKVDYFVIQNAPSKEFFGYHFLPPPKSDYIREYLSGIEDQRIRVLERNCYYILVGNSLTEEKIEAALRQIRNHGISGTGGKTDRPLKYLIQQWNQFFSDTTPTKVPRPEGF